MSDESLSHAMNQASEIQRRLNWMPKSLRSEIRALVDNGILALKSLDLALLDVEHAISEYGQLPGFSECSQFAFNLASDINLRIELAREFVDHFTPAMNALIDPDLGRAAAAAGLLPSETDVTYAARILGIPPEGEGDYDAVTNFTVEPFWLDKSPEFTPNVCLALGEVDFPASFEEVIDHADRHANTLEKQEPIEGGSHQARLLLSQLEGFERNIPLGKTVSTPTNEDLIGRLTLEKLCERSGLDARSAAVLLWLYSTPSRTAEREWTTAKGDLAMTRAEIDSARQKIEAWAPTLQEWLEEPSHTDSKAVAFNVTRFLAWRDRWNMKH